MAKFIFVVLAVAAGVGALSGVRGFSESVRTMLTSESRTIMAADLTARQFVKPSDQQIAALDALGKRGVDRTVITETVSMASSQAPDAVPVLVSIKAVDPTKYPYYGEVKLKPVIPLAQALTANSVAAGEDVLIRLGIQVGENVRIGSEDFRMAAVVESEPDRMSGSLNVGLRMMMSRDGFERTGLMQIGSRAAERYLFKLQPGGPNLATARNDLKSALPEALIADSSEAHPLISRGLNQSTTFLSLVSLIALIVGAIGVAMAMHAHLQQKMDNIAVMKSLGGTSVEIIRIYTLQTLMLGLLGGLVGIVVGRLVEEAFPLLINRIFEIKADVRWHALAALQGIGAGMLTTLLFTLPPLLAIRKIRPALILRRDMPDAARTWRTRWEDAKGAFITGVGILAGLGGIAGWVAGSPKVGGYFAGGLAVSLIVLAFVAWFLLRGLRLFLERSPWKINALTRQGLANLYRQGNQAQAILVALGLGVMFTLTVYLLQKSLIDEIIQTAPPGVPNVFLVGVTEEQFQPLLALLKKQEGVETPPQLAASVSVRLISIDQTPISQRVAAGTGRRFTNTLNVSWEVQRPPELRVSKGTWWEPASTEPLVSVSEEVARQLDIRLGSVLELDATGQMVRARVAALHEVVQMRNSPTNFVFNKPALEGLSAVYYGGVRMKPSSVGAMQRAVFKEFPTVSVVNIADALAIVQQVVDQIALVIRFLSGFAILAGAVILAASVAGTRFRRVREVVILKTLGGTRQHIRRIFSVEFLMLGATAGLLGSLLAAAFSSILLNQLLDAKFTLDWKPIAIAIVLTAVLANLSGWLASLRILSQKPLEVLRNE